MKIISSYQKFVNENAQVQPVEQPITFQTVEPVQETQPVVQPTTLPNEEQLQAQEIKLNNDDIIKGKVSKIIDYTCIKPDLTKEEVKKFVDEAIENGFYGICVPPDFVDYAVYEIEDNDVQVISILDFPDGKMSASDRLDETIRLVSDGVSEIDLALDIESFKESYADTDEESKEADYKAMEKDIKTIAEECHKSGVILKVIIESGILSFDELEDICHIVSKANVDFVQTSTGTKDGGADIEKIKEIRRLLPDYIKIKVSGGIRTLEQANNLYPFVDRIGTSVILK